MKQFCLLYIIMLILFVSSVAAQQEVDIFNPFNYTASPDTTAINKSVNQGEALACTNADSAIYIFQKTLRKSEQIAYTEGIHSSLFYLANIYMDKGNYDQCMSMFQDALTVCLRNPRMTKALPVIYNGIGNLYKSQSKYELAMNYYLKAISLIEQAPSKNISGAATYNNLGSVLMTFERDSEALYYLNKAEQEAKNTNNHSVLGYTWTNKGIIYMYQKNWGQSRYYLQSAIMLTHKYQIIPVERFALVSMSNMYLTKQMPNEAISYSQQALSLKGDINPYYQNLALRSIGESYFQLHDHEKSKRYLLSALDIAKKYNIVKGVVDTHEMLADIYSQEGLYKQAFNHIQKSYTLERNIQSENVTQNLNQLEVKYRTTEKDKDIIQKQLFISRQENNLKKKNLWIGGISLGLLSLVVLLLSSYRINRHKQNLYNKQTHVLLQEKEIGQLKAMVNGEEKERSRIAQEIHDGIMSQLMAVKFNVDMLRSLEDRLIEPGELSNVSYQLEEATKGLRKTAHNLSPDLLLQEGLATAIFVFCETIEKSTGIEIDFLVYGNIPRFDKEIELSIYRMTQELVQNIMKHAQATQIIVQLSYHNGLLSTAVDDNGRGFLLDEVANKGTGLNNIRSRVKALNGQLDIISNKGTGTSVHVEFNIQSIENTTEICL